MRVGINGMGRMGRLALRAALGGVRRADGDPRGENRLDVVHLNEVKGGAAATAHLLEFDSAHGRWRAAFGVEDDAKIRIDNKSFGFSTAAKPGDVAWGDLGENAAASLNKGNRVIVTGRLEQRSYDSKEGDKRSITEVVADELGPSLRWAQAQVERISRDSADGGSSGGSGGGGGGGGGARTPDPIYGDEEPF